MLSDLSGTTWNYRNGLDHPCVCVCVCVSSLNVVLLSERSVHYFPACRKRDATVMREVII